MKEIKNIKEFAELLQSTIKDTKYLASENKNDTIYENLLGQLYFVKKILMEEKRKPTFEEVESTSIGAIAVKNMEDSKPDYAENLMIISECFCYYDEFYFFDYLS